MMSGSTKLNFEENSLKALNIYNEDAFANVYKMVRVDLVLPVTTAKNKRSFSNLSLLKTYLISTKSEDCRCKD